MSGIHKFYPFVVTSGTHGPNVFEMEVVEGEMVFRVNGEDCTDEKLILETLRSWGLKWFEQVSKERAESRIEAAGKGEE